MHHCTEVIQGDFHKMPFPDASFDAVFAVEATCHASTVRTAGLPTPRDTPRATRFSGRALCSWRACTARSAAC